MVAVAGTGTLLRYANAVRPASPPVEAAQPALLWSRYLPLLLVNWGLTLYVSRLFRQGNALPGLLGRRWDSTRRAATDLALALATGAVIRLLEGLSARTLDLGPNAAVVALLPSTGADRLGWVLVACSVGFCEEVVYRGYLQTQLTALTRHVSAGVILQALLFGIAHGEQGLLAALRMAGYGLLLGALARFRRSLLPGIACHVGIDLASGLLR